VWERRCDGRWPKSTTFSAVPEPVRRYFTFALKLDQSIIARATFEQAGSIRPLQPRAAWKAFRAVERFTLVPPEFVWDASVRIAPFVSLQVHDEYANGQGASKARLAGLIQLGGQRGGAQIASASLVRYLAEAAWIPTALLPSEAVRWTAIDDDSARVALDDRGISVSLDVQFGKAGEIARVSTMRHAGRERGMLPWVGRFRAYARIHRMMIPIEAEVEWILPEGPVAVWRGRIVSADYTFV
jgi:hypothetical protein